MTMFLIIDDDTKEFVNVDSIDSVEILDTCMDDPSMISLITVRGKWHESPFTVGELMLKIIKLGET